MNPEINTSPTTPYELLQILGGLTEKQIQVIKDNFEPLILKDEKQVEE